MSCAIKDGSLATKSTPTTPTCGTLLAGKLPISCYLTCPWKNVYGVSISKQSTRNILARKNNTEIREDTSMIFGRESISLSVGALSGPTP